MSWLRYTRGSGDENWINNPILLAPALLEVLMARNLDQLPANTGVNQGNNANGFFHLAGRERHEVEVCQDPSMDVLCQ